MYYLRRKSSKKLIPHKCRLPFKLLNNRYFFETQLTFNAFAQSVNVGPGQKNLSVLNICIYIRVSGDSQKSTKYHEFPGIMLYKFAYITRVARFEKKDNAKLRIF